MNDSTAPDPRGMLRAIKPCPFCGSGSGVEVREGSTFRWRVAACLGCGATCGEVRIQTLGDGTREEWIARAERDAVAEWNRRPGGAQ